MPQSGSKIDVKQHLYSAILTACNLIILTDIRVVFYQIFRPQLFLE